MRKKDRTKDRTKERKKENRETDEQGFLKTGKKEEKEQQSKREGTAGDERLGTDNQVFATYSVHTYISLAGTR
jgi:hypothetical protein